jgi:hypothetical protein
MEYCVGTASCNRALLLMTQVNWSTIQPNWLPIRSLESKNAIVLAGSGSDDGIPYVPCAGQFYAVVSYMLKSMMNHTYGEE